MLNPRAVLLMVLSLIMAGCSKELLQRTSYETLQNIEQQRCHKDFSSECAPHESYAAYRRKRQVLQQPDWRPAGVYPPCVRPAYGCDQP